MGSRAPTSPGDAGLPGRTAFAAASRPSSPNAHAVRSASAAESSGVLGRPHRQHHVEQHPVGHERRSPARACSRCRGCTSKISAHARPGAWPPIASSSPAAKPCIITSRKSRSASSSVYAAPEPAPSRPRRRGRTGPLVEHRLEGRPDPPGGPLEHREEQVELGAEHPHDVGLGDARPRGRRRRCWCRRTRRGRRPGWRRRAPARGGRRRSSGGSGRLLGVMVDMLSVDYLGRGR